MLRRSVSWPFQCRSCDLHRLRSIRHHGRFAAKLLYDSDDAPTSSNRSVNYPLDQKYREYRSDPLNRQYIPASSKSIDVPADWAAQSTSHTTLNDYRRIGLSEQFPGHGSEASARSDSAFVPVLQGLQDSAIVDQSIFSPYDPVSGTDWEPGSDFPYLFLSQLFLDVQAEPRRNANIERMTKFFRSVIAKAPNALLPAVYLSINKIGPDYESQEYGVGDVIILKTLAQRTGRTMAEIVAESRRTGDLGELAAQLCNSSSSSEDRTLTVSFVFDQLQRISSQNTVDGKIRLIDELLSCCRVSESRYIIRAFQRNLRIGCSIRTVLVALASAFVLTPPLSAEERANFARLPAERFDRSLNVDHRQLQKEVSEAITSIRRGWVEYPDLSRIVSALLLHPVSELRNHCLLTPGIPIKSMQASPAKSVDQILKSFRNENVVLEYKYDGERVQIHLLEDGTVRVFSRNAESTTSKFPDIVAFVPKIAKLNSVSSCIIDAEAVAFDRTEGKPLPFQVLSTRKRKDVRIEDLSVDICVFAFDLIYLNGKSLLGTPLRQRRRLLHTKFPEFPGLFQFSISKETNDVAEIFNFLEASVRDNCEGLMVKCLDEESQFAFYEPDKRSHAWRKLKQDYMQGLTDSFDLVPIGAYYGKGKRTGTYGGYLLAVYDPENGAYQAICKIGTGFKDEELQSLTTWANDHLIGTPRTYYDFGDDHVPDVWLDASQVWEIKAASFSLSPVYKAAIGLIHAEKGVGLRFPRFIRVRGDKKPDDSCTTAAQIAELYQIQESSR